VIGHGIEQRQGLSLAHGSNEAPCGKPQGISMEKLVSLVTAMTTRKCHCEEQSDEAI